MARSYKKNRARGSRQSSYKNKFELGFELPKVKNKTVGQYATELYTLNKSSIGNAYNDMIQAASRAGGVNLVKQAKTQFPTALDYVKSLFGNKTPTLKKVRKIIDTFLAPISVKQMLHILKLVESDDSFYEELKLRANEDLSANRFAYHGNNIYSYTTRDGSVIRFGFIKYGSPSILDFI